jgi:hypothetical protein
MGQGSGRVSSIKMPSLAHISMAEGEVTSRQDGGAHMWVKTEVDATAAAGGMTRSVVRRSY